MKNSQNLQHLWMPFPANRAFKSSKINEQAKECFIKKRMGPQFWMGLQDYGVVRRP